MTFVLIKRYSIMLSTGPLIILLVSATIAAGQLLNLPSLILPKLCKNNEQFICGPTCIETCTYKPTACNKACKYGCFCADGYVRQDNTTGSPCIKREQCKKVNDVPTCGENEVYQTCGTACPLTCNDLRYPLPKPPKICILLCKLGCFCKEGFYRSDDGKCVPPEKCCGNHERYITCGSDCPETCQGRPNKPCTRQCVPGCFCGCSDYVRQSNATNSPCVHRDDCPKECTDDEDTQ